MPGAVLPFALLLLAQVPSVTPAPAGPYRTEGNRILDVAGRPYLIRGTRLPAVPMKPAPVGGFGPYSATTLITIRQHLNMNAVRLPVLAEEYKANVAYRTKITDIIHTANSLELLAILEAEDGNPTFWSRCAEDFKANSNVMFAVEASSLVETIRSASATQVIIAADPLPAAPNIIREVAVQYSTVRRQLEFVSDQMPAIVSGLDPQLDSPECQAFPDDPAVASKLVEDTLNYFDAHNISWTLSSFEPRKLISDYRAYNGTKLDDGWICGKPSEPPVGLGMLLLSHLWSAPDTHGLFAVNGTTGGIVLARGGISTGYGPILADRDADADKRPLPFSLANVSVHITDSRGAVRLAPLMHTSAGWTFISFIVPQASATGPAKIEIVRSDGSSISGKVIIADVAPGIFTATADGRGPAAGDVEQRLANGSVKTFPISNCTKGQCRAAPIPLSVQVSTQVRFVATGLRNAGPTRDVHAWVGRIEVPVVSLGPGTEPGADQLTIKLPATLAGLGETDVVFTVDGRLSNVTRINCAASPRVELGRYLFYDKRLSVNGTTSCATCHRQELAFTDGKAQAVGATGQVHPRSAMTLVNIGANKAFNWSDSKTHSLEEQALKPMFSTTPVEMGVVESRALHLLRTDPIYRPLFPRAFPGQQSAYSIANVAKVLAAFERTIVSSDSPWDRFHHGDTNATSEAAKRGEILFFQDGGASCFRCHSGPNFSDSTWHNTGLYNMPGQLSYPLPNPGLDNAGKFKTPTLRNIALTAPYMHDGSIATLDGVLDHYAAGGRTISESPFAGIGHDNPHRDSLIHGFRLTPRNRTDLLAFLESLTDDTLIHNPALADPWPAPK